jgi:hypothetical protein
VTWVMWNLVSVHLEIVLVSVEARFHPYSIRFHLGDEAQVEARFGPFGDSVNFDAR